MRGSEKRAERVKWFDALDAMRACETDGDLACALELVRACSLPEARWLADLLPAAVATLEGARAALLARREDALALFLAFCLGHPNLVLRAAAMGFAPAQAAWGDCVGSPQERFAWTQLAAAQGDRQGLFGLGECLLEGRGCAPDPFAGLRAVRAAAELEHGPAQCLLGSRAYEAGDWERYYWWGRAASRGQAGAVCGLLEAATEQLARLSEGGHDRILFEIGTACRDRLEPGRAFGFAVSETELRALEAAAALAASCAACARRAVECWSAAGRRLGVVRDIRIVIARMVFAEQWRWADGE